MWLMVGNGTNTGSAEKPIVLANIIGEDKAFPLCVYFPDKKTIDVIVSTPASVSGEIAIHRPSDEVASIEIGEVKYTLSPNPDNPRPGEFVVKDDKIIIKVLGQPPSQGMNLVLKVEPLTIPTDYVNPALFQVFSNLPIVGTISWTRSLEQHPSGSASLNALQSGIALVRSRFRKGSEIEFAGIGFSVSGYSDRLLNTHEYPGGVYEVSISFTGKWNRRKYNKPVLFKGGPGSITSTSNSQPVLQDPDCVNPKPPTNQQSTTTVAQLASKNSVSLTCVGTDWNVEIPKDIPKDATTNWLSELQARTRQNGAIVFFSSPGSVKAVSARGGNFWSVSVPTIEVSTNGDFEHNDGRFGYAVEYPKVKVDGKFSAPKEENTRENSRQKSDTINKPRWKLREPKILESINGDNDIENPPANTGDLKTLDLTWDTSGPTKTQEKTKTEDGLIIERTVTTYGFIYMARDIYHEGGEETPPYYREPATPYWRMVKQETETFNYDSNTGYLLGTTTTGWQYLRFKTENPEKPETAFIDTDEPEEVRRSFMFEFKKYPINGATAYFLEQHLDYYEDIEAPPQIEYKICLPDGSSRPAFADDPNYVPAFFVSVEMTHRNTFASSPHPDNQIEDVEDEDFIPLPDLTLGEETLTRKVRKILPSATTAIDVNGFIFTSALLKIPDRYTEYSSSFSASGPGFKNSSEETKVTTHDGRPGVATRKPPKYERVEPEATSNDPTVTPKQDLFDYYLLTPGYSISSPTNGSISFPYAKTLNAALLAAQTDLFVRDVQESVSLGFSVPFNPFIQEFDKIAVSAKFDFYNTVVLSASNSVFIQGIQNAELSNIPLITSPEGTRISAGIDRTIPVRIERVDISSKTQPPKQQDKIYITQIIRKDVKLGELLKVSIPTRRNY